MADNVAVRLVQKRHLHHIHQRVALAGGCGGQVAHPNRPDNRAAQPMLAHLDAFGRRHQAVF